MKRFIVIFIAILLSRGSFAQDLPGLLVNQQDATTGMRTLSTERDIVRTSIMDKHPMQVGITAIQIGQSDWAYYLSVAFNELVSRPVGKGNLLMIRTASGEVIELQNSLEDIDSRDWHGRWIESAATMAYENEARYLVTPDELLAMSRGIVKVRVQIGGGHFDVNYKKDRMGGVVAVHLEAITREIAGGGGIREGF